MSKRRDDDSLSSSSSCSSDESDEAEVFFWGCTLTRQNPIARWGEKMDDSKDSAFYQEHRLSIRQAVLGAGAVEGERNVVSVDSQGYDKEKVEFPILSLTLNHQEMCMLNMDFEWPVVFRLGQGSGPVVLTGVHLVMYDEDDEDDEDDSSSSSSSQRSLKTTSKKKKKKTSPPPRDSSEMSTSSTKNSSKFLVKRTRRSQSSEKPGKKLKPVKRGSKGRTSKESGSKKVLAKKKVTEGKKVAKKTKTKQAKVKEESD